MRRLLILLVAVFAAFALFAVPARAQLWDEEIGDVVLGGNDDGSVGPIDLPFPVRIYGNVYNRFWINNNGNVTFTGSLSEYTPFAFPNSRGAVIVAPFFNDVDTRPAASGKVHYSVKPDHVTVTWNRVGYFSQHTEKLNRFQVVFTQDGLVGFSYDDMQWATSNSGGFGGTESIAGFDAGNGVDAHVLWRGNSNESLDFLRHKTFWFNLGTGEVLTDAFPPNTSILTGPENDGIVTGAPVRFTFTGLDDVTPVDRLEFQWQLNDSPWSEWSTSKEASLTMLAEGENVFRVRARDLEGKVDPTPSERRFLFDGMAPTITDIAVVPTTSTAAISWKTSEPTTGYRIKYGETSAYGLQVELAGQTPRTEWSAVLASLKTNTEYHFKIFATDRAGNVGESGDVLFRTLTAPDLTIPTAQAPTTVYTDRAFELRWTDLNAGSAPALGAWSDRVSISRTASPEGATRIADFAVSGPLDPTKSYERAQFITLTRQLAPETGDYFLIVAADAGNGIAEGSEEGNNWRAIPIRVVKTPYPDLTVDRVDAPASANSGQTIEVQYVVKNVGLASTDASEWTDWVYLSADELPDGDDPVRVPVTNVSYLDTGESYLATATLAIPRNLAGAYKIVVFADGSGRGSVNAVQEEDETNNWPISKSIQIALSPVPNLQPTRLLAPPESFTGSPLPVSWRVQNNGAVPIPPAERHWNDRIYLSKDTTLGPGDRDLGTVAQNRALNVGELYDASLTPNVPLDVAGDWYVILKTDDANVVYELAGEDDNVRVSANVVHIQATPPDLVVQSVTLPASAKGDEVLNVQWRVKNEGAFPAIGAGGGWTDTVYLSRDATFDPVTATVVASVRHAGELDAGLTYIASTAFRMPVCNEGRYYAFVKTDAGNEVFEFDPTYDAEANNLSTNKPIDVAKNVANLTASGVTAPIAVGAGGSVGVSWTVRNSGTGPTNADAWNDTVYLSTSPNVAGGLVLGSVTHSGRLAPGAAYTASGTFVVPTLADGPYYVVVATDSGNAVAECTDEGDNASGSGILTVSNVTPDLTAAWATAPASGRSGQTVALAWRDTNSGTAPLKAVSWLDTVYLSTDSNLDGSDRPLGEAVVRGPLAVGASVPVGISAVLPALPSGTYYLLVKTDSLNSIFEGRHEDNNVAARAISVSPPDVDLVVTGVDAPAEAFAFGQMNVSWTVKNQGAESTFAAGWTDYVILSRDAVLDPTDRLLGYRQHAGALAGGESYAGSLRVDVPGGISGPYYVFVRTDWFDQVAEKDETNDFGYDPEAVLTKLPPPTDLVVASVSAPASGSPGELSTIGWTVRNAGTNPAPGLWQDAVYLSRDDAWDIGDVLVGRVDHVGDLAAGTTYTGSLQAELPAVAPGTYRVIVRTDVKNRVRESDERNNSTASASATAVDIQELTLGVPRASTLTQGKNRFYKVRTPVGETLRHTLDSQATEDVNDLYVRFGDVASLSAYDFSGERFFSPDQIVTVPDTQAGWYYSLARGEYVATGPSPFTILAELVPFSISEITPNKIGNAGRATIVVRGGRLNGVTIVALQSGGTRYVADEVNVVNPGELRATFRLSGAKLGGYALVLGKAGGIETTKADAVTIENVRPAEFKAYLDANLRPVVGRKLSGFATMTNVGNVDAETVQIGVVLDGSLDLVLRAPANIVGAVGPDRLVKGMPVGDSVGAAFTLRDVRAGETVTFDFTVTKYTATPFRGTIVPRVTTHDQSVAEIAATLEQARQAAVQAGNLPPAVAMAAADPESWFQYFKPFYVQLGVLDPTDDGGAGEMMAMVGGTPTFESLGFPWLAGRLQESDVDKCVRRAKLDSALRLAGYTVGLIACEAGVGWTGVGALVCLAAYDAALVLENVTLANALCRCYVDNKVPCGSTMSTICGLVFEPCPQRPSDPNEKTGPAGFGPERFVPFQTGSLYTVDFENVPTASAAARRVVIEDQIDPGLDPRSFRLKEIGFGKIVVTVPANRAFFQARVSLGEAMGGLLADVSASVNVATGKIRVVLTAIDPETGEEPEGALQGLLLPNDESGRGQGYVTYTIAPRSGTSTGTQVSNLATITFDTEAPIVTNTVTNTVDGETPTTRVKPLPSTSSTSVFVVAWEGSDDATGSGLQNYDVYVNVDGGGYVPWKLNTTDVGGTYEGEYGHTYSFYSVGRDNANNLEEAPESPDATVVLGPYPMPSLASATPNAFVAGGSAATMTVKGTGFAPKTAAAVNGTARTTTFVSATEIKVALTAADLARAASLSLTVANPTPGGGTSNVLLLSVGSAIRIVPSVTLVRNGANVVATVRLTNSGSGAATNLAATTGAIAGRGTTTALPLTVGALAPGASKDLVLTFAAPGAAGTVTTLRIAGRYDGGTFDATLRVNLP